MCRGNTQTLQSCHVALVMYFRQRSDVFQHPGFHWQPSFMLPISDLNLACSHFLLAQRQEATSRRLRVRREASSDWCGGVALTGFLDVSHRCPVETETTSCCCCRAPRRSEAQLIYDRQQITPPGRVLISSRHEFKALIRCSHTFS